MAEPLQLQLGTQKGSRTSPLAQVCCCFFKGLGSTQHPAPAPGGSTAMSVGAQGRRPREDASCSQPHAWSLEEPSELSTVPAPVSPATSTSLLTQAGAV